VGGVERFQHRMIKKYKIVDTEPGIETQPDYDNRGECDSNFRRPKWLDEEKQD
jgi:hypothetical protein